MPVLLNVYWSMPPKRDASREWDPKPQPGDVLISPIEQPQEFSQVLTNWLARGDEWRQARLQFAGSFAEQKHYDINRLIACANMFDILPNSAVPTDVELSKELAAAKEMAQSTFRSLPRCPERDSVLNALGRVGKSNLKQKIRYRARHIISAVEPVFPDLPTVTDEAVNCRNYYVHGSKPRFDYSRNFDAVTFFIDALEFVFAASDLIEAGWNVETWSKRLTTMSHPFARFKVSYAARLKMLRVLLKRA
jgi:hypothetical protein